MRAKFKLLTLHHTWASAINDSYKWFSYADMHSSLIKAINKIFSIKEINFEDKWDDFIKTWSKVLITECGNQIGLITQSVCFKYLYQDKDITVKDVLKALDPSRTKENLKTVLSVMGIFSHFNGIDQLIYEVCHPEEFNRLDISYTIYNSLITKLYFVVYSFKNRDKGDVIHAQAINAYANTNRRVSWIPLKYLLSIKSALKYNGFPKVDPRFQIDLYIDNRASFEDIADEITIFE